MILQVQQSSRQNIDQILDYHIKAGDGTTVPLSTVALIATRAIPQSLNHFQQLNRATIEGVAFPAVSRAALFESFRDPLIILFPVPLSIAVALIFLMALSTVGMPGATLNIYTQVGLVTLMELISKHGILIVEVANEMQEAGKSRREAILEAAAIRLRPILMTTAAMVLGVVPLIVATGAGALSSFSMGLVIASGLAVGTLFTLSWCLPST